MMPRSLVYSRLAVAFAQGIVLYFLYHAYELRAWPAGDQLIFASIVTVALFVPLILVAGVGNLRPWTLAIWIVIATAICAGLAAYNVYRGPIGNASGQWLGSSSHMRPAIIAILFVTHSLIVSGDAERHFIARYANYFDISWKHGVQLVLAGIFLGVFWALLFLGAKLFGLIRIELFADLIKRPWFAIPATMLVLTLAIHITDLRPGIVRGTQTLMLTLLSWLLPMMALIAFGFTVALSFTGLDPLWNTHRATAILLIAAFALILLINSAYQDGGPEHFRAAPLRYSSVLAAVLLAPLLGLASYALLLRVQQYGWTPDRIITLACIAVAACYAVGYFVAALRSGLMLRELETTNVLTAFFIVVVLLALFTPIADPARISVADQVNRLQSGSIPPDKFDFGFLRFGSGRYGMAALEGLAGLTDGPQNAEIAEKARQASRLQNRWQNLNTVVQVTPQMRAANITIVHPGGQTIPDSFLRQDWNSMPKKWLLPKCLVANAKCDAVLVDLDGDRIPEILLFGLPGPSAVFKSVAGDYWEFLGGISNAHCPAVREAMRAGNFELAQPSLNELQVNGQRLQVQLQRDCPPRR